MTGSWLSQVRAGVMLAAVYGLLGSAPLLAQTTPPVQMAVAAPAAAPVQPGSPERGKQLSYTCLGCHGVEGYRNAYPEYSVPRLKGQHAQYLVVALTGYRVGDRAHPTMHDQAMSLSDQDMADIASYFAGKPLVSSAKPPAGAMPASAALCVSCHGVDGIAVVPMYPTLAGQHEDYIVRAINEYKKGGRKNPIMAQMVASLKDADIAEIARFFAHQSPSLATESRPYTAFGQD